MFENNYKSVTKKFDMSELLDEVFRTDFRENRVKEYGQCGKYHQSESEGVHILKFNVAGNPKESVSVEVENDVLTVKTNNPNEKTTTLTENVNLKFNLKGNFDLAKLHAKQTDGILTVLLYELMEEKKEKKALKVQIN